MDKQDKTDGKKKGINKTLSVIIVVFAVIGVIAVGYLGVVGIKNLIGSSEDDSSNVASLLQDVKESQYEGDETDIGTNVYVDESGENTTAESTAPDFVDPTIPSGEKTEIVTENATTNDVNNDGKIQITFLGDSILDNFRGETGICEQVEKILDAKVYNIAIGGTSASVSRGGLGYDDSFDDTCGLGITKVLANRISLDVIMDCKAKEIIREHIEDIKKSDIFVIEYGINDFLACRTRVEMDNLYDPYTYEGALRLMIADLRKINPDAAIVLCQTTYIELYRDNGEYVGNTYTLDNGTGSAMDYNGTMASVVNAVGDLYMFKHEDTGINVYNFNDTVLDGIHLNENGRKIYAENFSKFLADNVIPNIHK